MDTARWGGQTFHVLLDIALRIESRKAGDEAIERSWSTGLADEYCTRHEKWGCWPLRSKIGLAAQKNCKITRHRARGTGRDAMERQGRRRLGMSWVEATLHTERYGKERDGGGRNLEEAWQRCRIARFGYEGPISCLAHYTDVSAQEIDYKSALIDSCG